MVNRIRNAALCAAVWASCAAVLPALGDQVIFKNGDRLTGTIGELGGGKLTIKTAVAGDVTVDMKDVESFSTDAPIEIKLNDGTTLRDQVTGPGQDPGTVQTAGQGAVAAQPVALDRVEAINPPREKWTGSVTAGGLVTRGNSNTESLSLSAAATRRGADDRISLSGGYFFSRQEDPDTGDKETTVDNWFAAGKYDYFLSKKLYLYGLMRIERDRIADLDLRLAPSVGLGYQWVEGPVWNFNTEAGIGWVYEDYETGDSDEHVAARLAYHYDRKINDKVSFIHNAEYLPSLEDLDDFNVIADAGVRAALTETMFTDFKIEYRYDATPAPGADKNDVRYILGVGWAF